LARRASVLPYAVEVLLDAKGNKVGTYSKHISDLDFWFDPSVIGGDDAAKIRVVLLRAPTHFGRPGTLRLGLRALKSAPTIFHK